MRPTISYSLIYLIFTICSYICSYYLALIFFISLILTDILTDKAAFRDPRTHLKPQNPNASSRQLIRLTPEEKPTPNQDANATEKPRRSAMLFCSPNLRLKLFGRRYFILIRDNGQICLRRRLALDNDARDGEEKAALRRLERSVQVERACMQSSFVLVGEAVRGF